MAYEKGEKIEPGIWRLKDDKEKPYLAEINYTDPQTGKRIRERKKVRLLDDARNWRKSREVDALRGDVRRTKDFTPRPFDEFADEYLENWSQVEKEPSTFIRDTNSSKHLKAFFGGTDISQIKRRDVEQYVAKRKAAGAMPGTLNRELSCLKNMLRKAVDWEYLESNPAWGVRQQREEIPEFEFLNEEEAERLIDTCHEPLKSIVVVALNTGMRRGELLALQWQDVKFGKGEGGIITVRKSKNHESRHIPMNARVREVLQQLPRNITGGKDDSFVFAKKDGEGLKSIRNGFEAAVKRAGIEKHIRFHDLRHTFASWLVMKGIDLRTVAKLVGHRDIRITMRYAHLAPEHLQAAVDALVLRRLPGTLQQGTDS